MAIGATAGAAAGGLASAWFQSDATKDASKEAKKASKYQTDAIMEMFNISREDMAPYMDVGTRALYGLAGYEQVSDITDEQRAQHTRDLEQYQADMATYNTDMEKYLSLIHI